MVLGRVVADEIVSRSLVVKIARPQGHSTMSQWVRAQVATPTKASATLIERSGG